MLEESESSIVALGKEIGQQLFSDLQERGAEAPQIYFLGANEAADWQYALYAEIQENFAQGGESVALQEKIVSGEQATKWLEGHPGELAVVAAENRPERGAATSNMYFFTGIFPGNRAGNPYGIDIWRTFGKPNANGRKYCAGIAAGSNYSTGKNDDLSG